MFELSEFWLAFVIIIIVGGIVSLIRPQTEAIYYCTFLAILMGLGKFLPQ